MATALQISNGFGFSLLVVPALLTLFPKRDALELNIVLSLVISLVMLAQTHTDVDRPLLRHLVVGSVLGLPLGILAFLSLSVRDIKIGLAVAILAAAVPLLSRVRVSRTRVRDLGVGFLSGFLGTSVGVPGPPLLAYMTGTGEQKALVRSTTLAFYLVVYGVAIGLQVLTAGAAPHLVALSALMLPGLAAGVALGQKIFGQLSPAAFRVLQLGILTATGAYLLFTVLGTRP